MLDRPLYQSQYGIAFYFDGRQSLTSLLVSIQRCIKVALILLVQYLQGSVAVGTVLKYKFYQCFNIYKVSVLKIVMFPMKSVVTRAM